MNMQVGEARLGYVGTAFSDGQRVSLLAQRMLDCLACLAAAPFALAIGLVIALLTWLEGGSVFYAQKRVGLGGRTFNCLKFRSMVSGAEESLETVLARDPAARAEWQSYQKLAKDPRITRLGQFIRTFSLDELPQLINVWRGEMSIVGPRPILIDQIPLYGDGFQIYCTMRPGITGLWQIGGRNNCTFAERVRLDMQYARSWSVRNDLRIIVLTVPAVFARKGAR